MEEIIKNYEIIDNPLMIEIISRPLNLINKALINFYLNDNLNLDALISNCLSFI